MAVTSRYAGAVERVHTNERTVTLWLMTVCVLVAAMVVVGGYVRLTRSGLSIVEWNVVFGTLPPLGEQAWQDEFAKYKLTPEFRIVNSTMDLEGYKRIFYLEWAHRLVARVAGLFVAIPLLLFLWRGDILRTRRGAAPYVAIGLLFALQGAMGWYMVASGLVEQPAVSHYRLTLHLLTALGLLGLGIWTLLGRLYPPRVHTAAAPRTRTLAHLGWCALALIVVQIAYGGLVAGLKAGHVSNTWPLMAGALVPDRLLGGEPAWLALVAAPVTVHFIHRWFGFAVLAIAVAVYWRARGVGQPAQVRKGALTLVLLILWQIALGVSVVLFNVQLSLALLHQATAVVMFSVAVYLTHRLRAA